ncbi:isocitrate lyase/PEP mutase family protein [Aquibium sp. LZ166]|uniref:Isocitrate lyase/PEP mutase family protein n=1 Tax=Aquibium pacificus TaxID=3153579 RepID=A0ABV3STE7_9HYPH
MNEPVATVQQIIGVYDGLSARIADAKGFDWLHVGGYNISGSAHGMPDVGLLTLTENLDAVRRIVGCTSRPVLVDGDDGYGNYLNVMRLVSEVERTGASGIHLEDQVFPKKCGHMENKRVVPASAFEAKIKAFVDTRKSERFLLFARTDAIATDGFEAAIERGNRYLEAGADVIFVEAPVSREQAASIPRLIDGPVLYNWVFRGKSPLIPREELAAMGYAYYLQADVLYAVAHALELYFTELKTTGTYGKAADRMISFDAFNTLVGLERIVDAERLYEDIVANGLAAGAGSGH